MRRERDEKETGMGVGRGLRKGGRCCDRLAGLAGRAQGRVVGGGGTCARVRAVGGGGTASMGSGCGRRRAIARAGRRVGSGAFCFLRASAAPPAAASLRGGFGPGPLHPAPVPRAPRSSGAGIKNQLSVCGCPSFLPHRPSPRRRCLSSLPFSSAIRSFRRRRAWLGPRLGVGSGFPPGCLFFRSPCLPFSP